MRRFQGPGLAPHARVVGGSGGHIHNDCHRRRAVTATSASESCEDVEYLVTCSGMVDQSVLRESINIGGKCSSFSMICTVGLAFGFPCKFRFARRRIVASFLSYRSTEYVQMVRWLAGTHNSKTRNDSRSRQHHTQWVISDE